MMMIPSAAVSRAHRQRGRSGTGTNSSAEVVFLWSDTSTWGGALPTASQAVTIPIGTIVKYDLASSPALGLVTLNGELRFDPTQSQTFTATGISIASTGAMQAGTVAAPWPWSSTLNIVINGPSASANKVSRAATGVGNLTTLVHLGAQQVDSVVDGNTVLVSKFAGRVMNRGAIAVQRFWNFNVTQPYRGSTTQAMMAGAVDTSVSQNVVIRTTNASTETQVLTLEHWAVRVYYGA